MLIDSIMGTIDHIYCDNTFHVITEQNHRRNTIVRRVIGILSGLGTHAAPPSGTPAYS